MEYLIEHQYRPLALSMSKRMTTGAYMPADVGHAITCARDAGANLPVGEVVQKHLDQAKDFSDARGCSLDSSSMFGVLRSQAGLGFEPDLVKDRDRTA